MNHPRIIRRLWLASLALLFASAKTRGETSADLVVYGGTSAGVSAAVQGARDKRSVILISPEGRLGGLTSGGLGWTDLGSPKIIGGISREFYHRIWRHYTAPEAWRFGSRDEFMQRAAQGVRAVDEQRKIMWLFEPSVAERVFREMAAEAGVKVIDARLDLKAGVKKQGTRIASIRMEDGSEISGRYYIDATYEGDLMAKAGVSYHVGREPNSLYGETLNGIQAERGVKHQLPKGVDPYRVKGDPSSGLLPGVNRELTGQDGAGDDKIQAYCYRMVLTDVAENRVEIDKPADYDEMNYELLFRSLERGEKTFFRLDRMPNEKTDSNNFGGVSCDFIGMNHDYPEADYATRERIAKAHENWQRGLVWTLQHHPRVPKELRKKYAPWGLPKDEFADNDHWSPQLYVREARRMVGETVETEVTLMTPGLRKRSIGMGAYAMDSHHVQRYVDGDGHVRNEGDVQVKPPRPYQIDYGAILPKQAECENLLVPVAMSASHIAYGSIRMEPVFMVLGQSAAAAAALAMERDAPVQRIEYDVLRARLLQAGQVLE